MPVRNRHDYSSTYAATRAAGTGGGAEVFTNHIYIDYIIDYKNLAFSTHVRIFSDIGKGD